MHEKLRQYVNGIPAVDQKVKDEARARVDSLIKPPGSLGKLEEIAVKLAGITGKIKNDFQRKCVLVMSADNGVVEEGVASAPQEITLAMTGNFIKSSTTSFILPVPNPVSTSRALSVPTKRNDLTPFSSIRQLFSSICITSYIGFSILQFPFHKFINFFRPVP